MSSPRVAILAGGESRRMGQDKAEILWQGETLLVHTVRVASEAGFPVIVVGRERPQDWPLSREVAFLPDAFPNQGPLGGLATALQVANGTVIALACDLPLLNVPALDWLGTQETGAHGVAVRNAGQWEPLFSVYSPAVLPLVLSQLAQGCRALHALIAAGDFRPVDAPPEVTAALVNVNTPADLAGLGEAARKTRQTP